MITPLWCLLRARGWEKQVSGTRGCSRSSAMVCSGAGCSVPGVRCWWNCGGGGAAYGAAPPKSRAPSASLRDGLRPPLTSEPLRPLSAAFVGQAPPALCPTRRPHLIQERHPITPCTSKPRPCPRSALARGRAASATPPEGNNERTALARPWPGGGPPQPPRRKETTRGRPSLGLGRGAGRSATRRRETAGGREALQDVLRLRRSVGGGPTRGGRCRVEGMAAQPELVAWPCAACRSGAVGSGGSAAGGREWAGGPGPCRRGRPGSGVGLLIRRPRPRRVVGVRVRGRRWVGVFGCRVGGAGRCIGRPVSW